MIFRSFVFAAMVAAGVSAKVITPEGDIPINSRLGAKLMSKAKPEGGEARKLEQNNQEADASWMYNYSIKYLGCSSLIQIAGEGGGDGVEEGGLYTQQLVKFGVCRSDASCSSCTGDATYVVNMLDFVEAYTEMKMDEQEQICENIRENCYCDNANDDEVCENQCYYDAGMSACIEVEGEEEFEVQRYLECAELERGDNNNNNGGNYNYNNNNNGDVNYYQQYYTGPYCSERDGRSILLGVFQDEGCTVRASNGVYEALNYGRSLPFSDESMVQSDCISCLQVDEDNNNNNNNNNNNGNNNNNNNNNNNYEINEICERTYEQAAKCENNLDLGQYFYPDTSGCYYINDILPKLERATRSISGSRSGGVSASSEGTAAAFAVIFAISTIILGAYSFFLYRKIHRAKVNLSRADGAIA